MAPYTTAKESNISHEGSSQEDAREVARETRIQRGEITIGVAPRDHQPELVTVTAVTITDQAIHIVFIRGSDALLKVMIDAHVTHRLLLIWIGTTESRPLMLLGEVEVIYIARDSSPGQEIETTIRFQRPHLKG